MNLYSIYISTQEIMYHIIVDDEVALNLKFPGLENKLHGIQQKRTKIVEAK